MKMTEWLLSTDPLWSLIGLMYCSASVYLRVFNTYEHPTWVWGTFLFIGSSIFMTINQQHLMGHDPTVAAYIEYGTLFAFLIGGIVMFYLAIGYAKKSDEIEKYQKMVHERYENEDH